MLAILKREIKNYMKRPLFWIGIVIVTLGVFQAVKPYLSIHYLSPGKEIVNDLPDTVHMGDVYEGYIPVESAQRREIWEKKIENSFISDFQMCQAEAESIINNMKVMDISEACKFLEKEYGYYGAIYAYQDAAYRKGTADEINAYLEKKLQNNPFSYYFARKFADFAGLFMGFFATVMLSVLFLQDTRKNTYELLHTKPVSAGNYVAGKVGGGFLLCLMVLAILNLVFWGICFTYTRSSGFEVRLLDFVSATCRYILPNMLMIVCIYSLISLVFKNPLPAVPLLILYLVYSNMGGRNAEGVYGYYGRSLAIMVRFPGQFFDTAPPPMALLNQSFLILASVGIILISVQIWKRRRM